MGCGSSQTSPGHDQADQQPANKPASNGAVRNGQSTAVGTPQKRISSTDSNANRADAVTNNQVPKSVMFTVALDDQSDMMLKPPPPRLKRLAPLGVPQLTADELKERQKIADEKRQQELQRKQSASRKSSRRRREILMAQQFGAEQQTQQEQKIEESLASAGKTREAKLNDVKERQRVREERAKRAREKARKLNQLDQADLGILEVEKDESNFNADDGDSWLDGENNTGELSSEAGERIYSGRASPKKRFHGDGGDLGRGVSASTIDSFDNAFNRKPPSASHQQNVETVQEKDDFFDS